MSKGVTLCFGRKNTHREAFSGKPPLESNVMRIKNRWIASDSGKSPISAPPKIIKDNVTPSESAILVKIVMPRHAKKRVLRELRMQERVSTSCGENHQGCKSSPAAARGCSTYREFINDDGRNSKRQDLPLTARSIQKSRNWPYEPISGLFCISSKCVINGRWRRSYDGAVFKN